MPLTGGGRPFFFKFAGSLHCLESTVTKLFNGILILDSYSSGKGKAAPS